MNYELHNLVFNLASDLIIKAQVEKSLMSEANDNIRFIKSHVEKENTKEIKARLHFEYESGWRHAGKHEAFQEAVLKLKEISEMIVGEDTGIITGSKKVL